MGAGIYRMQQGIMELGDPCTGEFSSEQRAHSLPSTLCIPYRPAPLPHMPVSLSLSCLLSLYSNLLAHIHMQRCASHHSHALYCIPDPLHPDPVCLCVLCRLVSRVATSAALARSRCSWATRTLMQRWQGWHSCAWGGLPGLWPCLYLCLLCIYINRHTYILSKLQLIGFI